MCGPDEHHLILEYNKGDTWGDTVADRHNRFILSDDVSNGQLLGLESLHKHVNDGSFKADVVVVAGALLTLRAVAAAASVVAYVCALW